MGEQVAALVYVSSERTSESLSLSICGLIIVSSLQTVYYDVEAERNETHAIRCSPFHGMVCSV